MNVPGAGSHGPVRLKVCCICSEEEAGLAIRGGASALGLVSEMPSGPGVIDETLIRRIARSTPPGVATFLLTALRDPAAIIAQQRRCGTDTLQLVNRMERGALRELRTALAGISMVQVIHVRGSEAVDEARDVESLVDAILLDSGDPDAEVAELGGTGRTHDWEVSRRIRDAVAVPVFLAGGLGADNVTQAILAVRPYGIDVCSGLRTDGALDPVKLAEFTGAIRAAG